MPKEELPKLYRDVPMRDWAGGPDRPREVLLEAIQGKLVPTGKALDICVERIWNPIYLAQSRFDVTALFHTQEKMEETRKMASETGLKVDCIVGSWRDIAVKRQIFDFVLDMECFGHLDSGERDVFIEHVHSLLKKGGYFLLMVLSYKNGPGEGHFTKRQIESMFHPRFEILKVDLFDSAHDSGTPNYISFLMRRT